MFRRKNPLQSNASCQASSTSALPPYHLMPFESAPHERAPYGSRDLELRQPGYLYTPIGPHVQPNDPSRQCYPVSQISPDEVFHGITEYTESPTLRQQQAQQKKARQWAKWTDDVIPILLQHFLTILRKSESL